MMTHMKKPCLSTMPFFLVLFLSLFSCSLCQVNFGPKKQTIFLHIGPMKTGTTHLQSFIHANRQRLKTEKLCWPEVHSYKSFNSLQLDITDEKNLTEWVSPIQRCLMQAEQNTIISGETFSLMTSDSIIRTKEFLTNLANDNKRNVEIKVILTYREWLRLAVSRYTELIRDSGRVSNKNNFIDFLLFSASDFRQQYMTMIDRWSNVFGLENLIMIDYYGIVADEKDITEVIICEIANAFCGKVHTLQPVVVLDEQLNSVYLNFIFAFDDYLNIEEMKQCSFDSHHLQSYLNYLTEKRAKFPTFTSNLEMLLTERFRLNDEMFDRYGHLMLHANKTANEMMIRSNIFQELDVNGLFQNPVWEDFMVSEKVRLTKEGKICHLSTGNVVTTNELQLKGYNISMAELPPAALVPQVRKPPLPHKPATRLRSRI